jgi:hypothetical protein
MSATPPDPLAALASLQEANALAQSYDDFYGGAPAPLSEVTAALYGAEPQDGAEP